MCFEWSFAFPKSVVFFRLQATLCTAVSMSVMDTRHYCPLLWMEMPVELCSPQDGLSPFSSESPVCSNTSSWKAAKGTARGEHRPPDSAEKGVRGEGAPQPFNTLKESGCCPCFQGGAVLHDYGISFPKIPIWISPLVKIKLEQERILIQFCLQHEIACLDISNLKCCCYAKAQLYLSRKSEKKNKLNNQILQAREDWTNFKSIQDWDG